MRLRPLEPGDADAVHALMCAAFDDLSVRQGRPPDPHPDPVFGAHRFRHLLTHDGPGSWAAEDDAGLAGVAMAVLREGIWGLSLLLVRPDVQSGGIGRELLARALGHGPWHGALILSSDDARAMRAYARAGFELRPAIHARGVPRREALAAPDVRAGTAADLALTAEVDREIRGGGREVDMQALLVGGIDFLVLESRGYAFARDGRVRTLAARDEAAAAQLLRAALATAAPGAPASMEFVTAGQDWAIAVALEAGLSLQPYGPVYTRGRLGPLRPYLPSGAFQ